MRDFWGINGYVREAEGYLSWQHLAFVSTLMLIMVFLAVFIGRKYKHCELKQKNRVLIVAALLIDGFELFKIVFMCISNKDAMYWVYVLPLFLCSIQLITIPLAAFSKGRIKEIALDFVVVFGLLGAVLGTYFAGNNYAAYPVISFDNVISGITHSISGFASLYIIITGMAQMRMKNIFPTMGILSVFGVAAYIANIFVDRNYMFLSRGDGTPYDIIYGWVNGNAVIYPICVMGLFFIYISAFYWVYGRISNRVRSRAQVKSSVKEKIEIYN